MNKPYSEVAKKILTFLFISGAFIIAPPMTPKAAQLLWKIVFKKIQIKRRDSSSIQRLVKSKYIRIVRTKNETRIELTPKGEQTTKSFMYSQKHTQAKRWDHIWRIVMYDIPSKHKHERDALRQKVKELGMYQLQKSVWIYPYDCKDEIQFLCDTLNLSYKKHILYFETKEVPETNELQKVFGLQ